MNRYPETMTTEAILQKSIRYDRGGKPLEVVIPYEDFVDFIETYGLDLTDEEIEALVGPDIGLLFHFGVNGQILMHFAAFHQIAWADYLQLMRDGITTHGPVREGVYAMTTDPTTSLIPPHQTETETT